MDRRTFVSLSALASAAPAQQPTGFRFVHFTDTHIQPELRAREGVEMAFAAINAENPDFILGGGDFVMDIDSASAARSTQLMDLYLAARKGLKAKLYEVPGNHDVYGMSSRSPIAASDPRFGKKVFQEKIGPLYQSFDHKGWHLILLDSIGSVGREFVGSIGPEQLDWLKADLARTGRQTPIVVLTHIPLATAALAFTGGHPTPGAMEVFNAFEVLQAMAGYRVKAVLQGHTHIVENISYQGCQYITSGAVSGEWWRGDRNGNPPGYGVLTVDGDRISWVYKTYGWKFS
jgi:Icc protein